MTSSVWVKAPSNAAIRPLSGNLLTQTDTWISGLHGNVAWFSLVQSEMAVTGQTHPKVLSQV